MAATLNAHAAVRDESAGLDYFPALEFRKTGIAWTQEALQWMQL